MFGDATDDLGPAPPVPTLIDSADTVVIDAAPGATSRNVNELSASIKKAGGALVVYPNSSAYLVAINNGLRYSVTAVGNGQYRITEASNTLFLVAIAAVIGLVVLSRR